MAVIVVVL